MIDDVSDIAEWYSSNLEGEHSRLERHQLEYDLSWRYLDQYLPSQGGYLGSWGRNGKIYIGIGQAGLYADGC